ncbi:MAG: tRNA (N(6)-L-threonylcarbamoyladenosine(37)-C(2))-methylthiotransferase MtaB [Bacilli bacterium]
MNYNIFTLGCKVNIYESNAIIDLLNHSGYQEVSIKEKSDISIINTCTVTNTADNKSLKAIKHVVRENSHAIIIVMGCFAQTSLNIVKTINGVNIIIGNKNKSKIITLIEEFRSNNKQIIMVDDINDKPFEKMMLNNFNKTRAFVKIQDGCNNYCSYCIIPYARGEVCSRNKNDILNEIVNLISSNHKEIVLTGIHTGHYGQELSSYNFASLLKDIIKIKGLERLRISSIEINEITDDVLNVISYSDILVNHMHIPLQSGSNIILKLMNRKYNKEEFIMYINKLKKIRPDIAITTDVIVGFPYETDELFNESIDTIRKINFSKIHVFPYSKRKGTKAASMDNQVDETVKKKRVKILMDISKDLEINYMSRFLNEKVNFLVEKFKDGMIIGHTENYLLIKANGNVDDLNSNVNVIINKIQYPYCLGERF